MEWHTGYRSVKKGKKVWGTRSTVSLYSAVLDAVGDSTDLDDVLAEQADGVGHVRAKR